MLDNEGHLHIGIFSIIVVGSLRHNIKSVMLPVAVVCYINKIELNCETDSLKSYKISSKGWGTPSTCCQSTEGLILIYHRVYKKSLYLEVQKFV